MYRGTIEDAPRLRRPCVGLRRKEVQASHQMEAHRFMTMNIHRKRILVAMLLLSITTLLIFGTNYLPAYAQPGAGDQLVAQVQPLTRTTENDVVTLTTNNLSLAPGEQRVYRFDYNGGEQNIRISMEARPTGSAQFQVWNEALIPTLNADPTIQPLGQGEPISAGSEFSLWEYNTAQPTIFYVTLRASDGMASQVRLNITSPGLAPNQPGIDAPTPTSPIETPTEITPNQPTPIDPNNPNPGDPNNQVPTAIPPTPVPVPTVDPLINATGTDVAVVIAAGLNVRSGPSTSYPVLTTVPAGTQLIVLGRNEANTWIGVRLENGTQGWVTRSLTNYTGVSSTILTPEPLPAPTLLPGITATPTPDTTIVVVQAATPEPLDGNWRVIREGETHWYTFQYRGGGLPVHVWMDVEPDQGAIFNILNQETALSILQGSAPNVVNAIGRGTSNPVEPGYVFWRADFPEADIFYVMVQHRGPGNVVYAIHVAGPGVSRPVPQ